MSSDGEGVGEKMVFVKFVTLNVLNFLPNCWNLLKYNKVFNHFESTLVILLMQLCYN